MFALDLNYLIVFEAILMAHHHITITSNSSDNFDTFTIQITDKTNKGDVIIEVKCLTYHILYANT